jgi:hypothetical protein
MPEFTPQQAARANYATTLINTPTAVADFLIGYIGIASRCQLPKYTGFVLATRLRWRAVEDAGAARLTRLSENLKRAPENMTPDEFEWLLTASLRGLLHAPASA